MMLFEKIPYEHLMMLDHKVLSSDQSTIQAMKKEIITLLGLEPNALCIQKDPHYPSHPYTLQLSPTQLKTLNSIDVSSKKTIKHEKFLIKNLIYLNQN